MEWKTFGCPTYLVTLLTTELHYSNGSYTIKVPFKSKQAIDLQASQAIGKSYLFLHTANAKPLQTTKQLSS